MKSITVYSTGVCPYCVRAKMLLDQKGLSYQEIRIDQDETQRDKMMELTGRRTVPQIIIGDDAIGGSDDLWALEQSGELDKLLNS